METYFGMLGEELLNRFGFVCGEIVEHNVDLLCPTSALDQVREESDEFIAGVAMGGFSLHLSCFHIQRSIQGQRSMPVVFKSMSFGPPR